MAFELLLTMMSHNYNTRGKKRGNASNDDDPLTNTKLEENIINHINASVSSLRDEFNLKDIIINRLQDENTHLQNKCKSLEGKVTSLEENLNSLDQYGRGTILFFQAYQNVWLMMHWRLQQHQFFRILMLMWILMH